MICDRCGTELRVGAWPFCPHGTPHNAVIGDEIPGGQVIEHLGDQPMTFYSKQAIREEADRRGLRPTDRWAGASDQHLTNWAAGIDAQTLANAAELVTRGSQAPASDPAALQSFEYHVSPVTEVA